MKIKIATEIRQHSRRWSNGWAVFRCCCFSTVLWTTVMNENNNTRCHFFKYLFENPNVSVLQWNALYNFSVMCPILIDTPFLAPKKTVIDSSRANFSLDLLTFFFLQSGNWVFSSFSTFHLYISSMHFIDRMGDLLNLPQFYRASSISWRAPTGKW